MGVKEKHRSKRSRRTLYENQLQEAREAAIDILNKKEPEEALSSFSQRQTVSTDGHRYPRHVHVFAVEDEMQQGLSDEQATETKLIIEATETKLIIEEGNENDHYQHKITQEEQEQNFVINNSEVGVGEKDHLPFTERSMVIVEAASAPV